MTTKQEIKLKKLEEALGYSFKNLNLLQNALIHSSFANEIRINKPEDNERLEFLGDAVLELIMSEVLYRQYPEKKEGELSKIRASKVCESALAYCARQLNLNEYIRLGKGEKAMGGAMKASILSDACEAVIGAIYLDGGFTSAKEYVIRVIVGDVKDKELFFDSKTMLQQLLQGIGNMSLNYAVIGETGPDHAKTFKVAAFVDGKEYEMGSGHTKKAAEQDAARRAIERFNSEHEKVD